MYFFISIVAALGYALQSVLMASWYRRIDTLSAVAYRGLTLGITMLPLLFFTAEGFWEKVPSGIHYVLSASVITAIGNWSTAKVFRALPVAQASALCLSLTSVSVVIFSYIFLGEALSVAQLLCIFGLVALVVSLGISKSSGNIPDAYSPKTGIFYSILTGLFASIGFVLIAKASRVIDPIFAGWAWEFLIGVVAGLIAIFRKAFGGPGLKRLSRKAIMNIGLYSSPTAIGTAAMAWAVTLGPVAVVSALISTNMVFATLLAYPLYGERLTRIQWLLLFFVFGMIALLKLSSG